MRTFSFPGCTVEPDHFIQDAYVLRFDFGSAITTVRVGLRDMQSGADLVITHMTTLSSDPAKRDESAQRRGRGRAAIIALLAWAHQKGMQNILAVQVQEQSEGFWSKCGFEKMGNRTNDFRYVPRD